PQRHSAALSRPPPRSSDRRRAFNRSTVIVVDVSLQGAVFHGTAGERAGCQPVQVTVAVGVIALPIGRRAAGARLNRSVSAVLQQDRKSTRLNSSHVKSSYA